MTAPNLTPINLSSLSFESILSDLKRWLDSKPDGAGWRDFYDSSDGTIIAEWIAGLASFRAYQELVRIRESQLDTAQLPSSVYNLAFNRGLMIPPGTAPELILTIDEADTVSVDYGDLVGLLGAYETYSLESKTLNPGTNQLRVVVGHRNDFIESITSLPKFKTFEFKTRDLFTATQMERLIANTQEILLQSDPNYLQEVKNDFLLRRTLPGVVRVYIGNGVLGWHRSNVSSIQYQVLSYAADIMSVLISAKPVLSISGFLISSVLDVAPTYAPAKEDIRSVARYYPLDGRIVTDTDYEVAINKYYGGLVHDVYSFNSDPVQHVYIIKRPSFDEGQGGAAKNLEAIRSRVDVKRALGMQVIYHTVAETEGIVFNPTMRVDVSAYTNELASSVTEYLLNQCYRFFRETKTLTAVDLAIELSARFSVRFTPLNQTESVAITPSGFFKRLTTPFVT